MKRPFKNMEVAKVFSQYPKEIAKKLLFLRDLIFDVAAKTKGVGELEEALKWGQPSYIPNKTKSGSLVRIDQVKSIENGYAIYFHCQTSLVSTFREIYPRTFKYEGNRAIHLNTKKNIPLKELKHCIELAFTYYLSKN